MAGGEYPWERPLGAVPGGDGTVEFRVWAPHPDRVDVRVGGADHELADEGYGVRSARVPAADGDDYVFVLDGHELPDPASRHQPAGLRGPSRVVDPNRFEWTDAGWGGAAEPEHAVLYELHVGTFTKEGTFEAAIEHLPKLADLGVTHVELMPVAEFPGARGWGYDGVYISAAQSSYGGPLGLQRLGHAAAWADDFHHALRVLLTGDRSGYYEEFGRVDHLAKCYRRPFVHDGDYSTHRKRRFGAPAFDRPVQQFVVFDQNHDQVGNRAFGDRLPDEARPLAAFCTLLAPFVPMLFMGEEYGERAPFQFFTDHIDEDIATATREGRRREFAAFAEFAAEEVPDPQDAATFERSKLTRDQDSAIADLYAKLLEARRALPAGRDVDAVDCDGSVPW